MMLVYTHQETVKHLVWNLIPHLHGDGFSKASTAIGVADNMGNLVGGFVYTDFSPADGTIEISVASITKKWLTRKVLATVFSYPFLQLGCQMVYMRALASDKPLGRQLLAYGFEAHPIPRMFGRGNDGVIFTLTVEDWLHNGFHKELH